MSPFDQVISANERTQGNKGQKGISLVAVDELKVRLSYFVQRTALIVEFETLFESMKQVVVDLLESNGKVSSSFKNSTSFVLQQYRNQANLIGMDQALYSILFTFVNRLIVL